MQILCIKSVVMDGSGTIAFSEGKAYEAAVTDWGIDTTNDEGHPHQLFCAEGQPDWDWFVEYFG